MQLKRFGKFNGKYGLMGLLALTPVLPIGLSGCPCACTQDYPSPPYSPFSVALGDFNSDGAVDLAVGTIRRLQRSGPSENIVSIVLQNRNSPGTFQQGIDVPSPAVPIALAAADIDATGGVDLIVVGEESSAGNLSAMIQTNAPQQPLSNPIVLPNDIGSARDLAVADLNNDNLPDLAVVDRSGAGSIAVLLQHPAAAGVFFPPSRLAIGQLPTAVAIGDLNGDGRPDLAATTQDSSRRSGKISLFFASAATPGQFLPRVDLPVDSGPTDIAIVDLNGDGRLDLMLADELANRIVVLPQNSLQAGSFDTPVPFSTGSSPDTIAVGDLNGDGRSDVVTANLFSSSVSVLLQSPVTAGVLLPAVNHSIGGAAWDVAIGDVNGDSRPDIAIAAGNRATLLFNSAVTPGTFGAPVQVGP